MSERNESTDCDHTYVTGPHWRAGHRYATCITCFQKVPHPTTEELLAARDAATRKAALTEAAAAIRAWRRTDAPHPMTAQLAIQLVERLIGGEE